MSIYNVLITAACAVVLPLAAGAQSTPELNAARHDCGMMAAMPQASSTGTVADATPAGAAKPMACCGSKTAPGAMAGAVDHSAAPPEQAQPMAAPMGTGQGTAAAGCCGGQMAAGPKMPAGEMKVPAGDKMAAGQDMAGCCCRKAPQP